MKESGASQERINLSYWDGANSTVQQTIASKSEFSHVENARAKIIGSVEKREGQVVIGTDSSGELFIATGNYGLAYFEDSGTASKGIIRISSRKGEVAEMYYLDHEELWRPIENDSVRNLSLSKCDFANMENSLVVVNGSDPNMVLSGDIEAGLVVSNAETPGSMFGSPRARKVAAYKSRIYLADYYDAYDNNLKTTVLRSSYPLGIISLLSADLAAKDISGNWVFQVTDTKYFYTDDGMNIYDIYRGNNKVARITINDITATSITAPNNLVVFMPGHSQFLSSDEIWVYGTYSGEKQYRWQPNSTTVGRDVKQYDTFRLSGGDEDSITLLETVGNVLLIANKNSIMSWNDYTLETFDNRIGCASPSGYIKRGDLYFMHYSGLYATSGGVPKLISRKIEKYILGATKEGIESCAAGYKGLSVFFSIGDVTLYNNDGSVYKILPDVCIEYASADQNCYIHTNVIAENFRTFIETNGRERLLSTSYTAGHDEVLGNEMIKNGSFNDGTEYWTVSEEWEEINGALTYRVT